MNYKEEFLKVFEEYSRNTYSELYEKEMKMEVQEETVDYNETSFFDTKIVLKKEVDKIYSSSIKSVSNTTCFFKSVEISKPGREEVQKELEKEANILAIF